MDLQSLDPDFMSGFFYCKGECCQQEDTLDERNMRNAMRILEENEMLV